MNRRARRFSAAAAILGVLCLGGCAGTTSAPVEVRPAPGQRAAPAQTQPPPARHEPKSTSVPKDVETGTVSVIPLGPEPGRETESGRPAPRPAPPGPVTAPNSAVVALVERANRDATAGRYATAAASLERAIKIEPGNAWLWHRLAVVRFDEGRADQAMSLATRSNALAGDDDGLRARNWRLIARVHRLRGDEAAARGAESNASGLSAPRT